MVDAQPKPFLRWAGSKRQLLPVLQAHWHPQFARYVEPFAGSASLYFAICPTTAILGDLNGDLIDAFLAVRENPRQVRSALDHIPPGRESYYELRSLVPSSLPTAERAARFIFLNRYCFNGLYRTNQKGQFNVPYAPHRTGRLPTLEELEAVAKALQPAQITCADFEVILDALGEGDFVYLDPPYATTNSRAFTEYYPASFSIRDIPRLFRCLRRLDDSGARFVLSYAHCQEVCDVAKEWAVHRVRTRRNVAGFAGARRTAEEILITNDRQLKGSRLSV